MIVSIFIAKQTLLFRWGFLVWGQAYSWNECEPSTALLGRGCGRPQSPNIFPVAVATVKNSSQEFLSRAFCRSAMKTVLRAQGWQLRLQSRWPNAMQQLKLHSKANF